MNGRTGLPHETRSATRTLVLAALLAGCTPLEAQAPSPTAGRAPVLTISATQRNAVRAAAAPYRGSPVRIVVERPTAAYERFARGLATALESAGLAVTSDTVDSFSDPACPRVAGLRVMYGPARSGAVNAIAEALVRSRSVPTSVSGCTVAREDELTFILSGGAS